MTVKDRVRRTRTRPQPEELRAAQDLLSRVTGKRLDFRALEPAESLRVVELVRAARSARGGLTLSSLGRGQTRELETLVEKAAGLPSGALQRERDEEVAMSKIVELARRANRLPITRRQEDSLLKEVWVQISEDRALYLDHLGLLLYVLAAFQAGASLGPGSRVDRDADGEPTIAFNARLGLCGYATGDAAGTLKTLEHLARNTWIKLERRGPQVTVRLGPRARRVLREGAK